MQHIETFITFAMRRKIITYGGYFERFIATLTDKERKKIDYIISLLETEDRMPVKFINNIYRIFFIFDEGQIVVLFNGFQKKDQKTPKQEIEKALKIKEAYYGDKHSSNQRL